MEGCITSTVHVTCAGMLACARFQCSRDVEMISFHLIVFLQYSRLIRIWSWLHGLAFRLGIQHRIIFCKNQIYWLHIGAENSIVANDFNVPFLAYSS